MCYNYKESMKREAVDKQTELLRFEAIWNFESDTRSGHTVEKWNERAEEWEKSLLTVSGKERSELRSRMMCDFIKKEGALSPMCRVMDIGSGSGSLAFEIAPHVHYVKGIDFSPGMCALAEKRRVEKNIDNVSFEIFDFSVVGVDELTINGKYDLVCSSITPAIRGYGALEKMMSISSKYCFNASFVHKENDLYNEILKSVFNKTVENGYDGHWHSFYAMFNKLFLCGFYPVTGYFDEYKDIIADLSEEGIDKIAGNVVSLIYNPPKFADKMIKEYIVSEYKGKKSVKTRDMRRYGMILWNVNKKTAR